MKIRYFVCALAVLMFTACDSFLQPESLSTFDDNYIFSNIEDARKAVNSIYVHFNHDGFRSRLSNNMTGNTDIEHSGGSSDGARYQIWRLDAQPNNGDLGYVWDIGYKAIRDANIAIEGISDSPALNSSDEVVARNIKHLLGEAYTLRAYWYSMLIYYFGDVPFMTEAPKAGVDFNLPRKDRNEILTAVIDDLINIEEDMMWADQLPNGIEQVNREYTMGMIARLSLQRGGYFLKPNMSMERKDDYLDYYQIANDYTQKLINLKDRPLPEDYSQVFMNQNKFVSPVNSDILFEVPFPVGEGDVGWNIGVTVEKGNHPYGSGGNYMSIPATYYYSFDKQDKRRDVTCAWYMINEDFEQELVSVSNIAQGKWSRHFLENPPGPSTAKGTGINWPMMRYSDVLLMHAEAENELNGPTAKAKEALKRVRRRAFPDAEWSSKVDQYVDSVSASKESFFNAIVNERAWEFGGEMTRKYDLIRWDLYHEKVQETVDGLKKMADDAYYGTGDLPDYVYVKHDENGDLMIYNRDEKVNSAPDDTWERRAWLIGLVDEDQPNNYPEWLTRDWANYNEPVRYIFPIPTIGIDNSKGVLKNDGYNF
ncbi:RagB/SusD family nutrient uptake outer membrane protein [Aliifodinibius sp. S!AR15-10]|uniref:RagB/SusD family nutrient uptake outer membrane protein n=1 Tax=Aliifodinibius sp. S!AR15-10 TaxID=2950437 RepID=UPI002862BC05|nr:RagB/SusD family nutrient uptake outer membrane protein [Aliifodinibius sp. S!AR15-10]MDR8393600.1 RagB/SusD family nutrient uptake outer membrane protein [Aliifodinibius sp. S!AR15-10]